MSETTKHMPVLLSTPGSISRRDIKRAEKLGGFCVIECKDPETTRFVDAPLSATIDDQSRAGMELVRYVVGHNSSSNFTGGALVKFYVQQLISRPSPPHVDPTKRVAKVASS